jgi:hypothetical protein
MRFAGQSSSAAPVGGQKLPGTTSYLVGAEREWIHDIPNYSSVRYTSIYPGIDAVFHGNGRQLEYDFIVSPGTDPSQIRLAFDGVLRIGIDAEGNLDLVAPHGTIKQLRPTIWQDGPTGRRQVDGRYVLAGRSEARLQVGAYDRTKTLVIDPVIQYSTYFGSTGNDQANAVAADSSGNAFIAGNLISGGIQYGFVSKLNASGNAVVYTVYLGSGSCNADVRGIAVDSSGNAIVTGYYTSLDTFGYCNDKQVLGAKINSAGNAFVYQVVWGGYEDYGNAVAVDAAGNAYFTGSTDGNFLTTAGVINTTGGFPGDAFITKLTPTGALVYSTYLGGSGIDEGHAIAVDTNGNAYVAGSAGSINFPVTGNAVQPTMPNTVVTGFVTEVNSTATQILYSTYLGGSYGEGAYGIKVDGQGKIHVTGDTNSPDFPTTANAWDRTCGTDGACNPYYDGIWHYAEDMFYTRIDPLKSGLAGLIYSTYLGGTNRDLGEAIALDGNGRAWITGRTASIGDFPIVAPTQSTIGGDYDAFVVEIDPAQSGAASLLFSTFLGGALYEEGTGIAADTLGDIYVTGYTSSTNFPVLKALQSTNAGGNDAFVVKFGNPAAGTLASASLNPTAVTGGSNSTGTVTLSSAAGAGGTTVTLSSSAGAAIPPTTVLIAAGQSSATFTISTVAVATVTSATITATYNSVTKTAVLTVNPAPAALSAVTISPARVTGGTSSTGTVTLTAAAPTGGAVITLSSSSSTSASVPASVTIAANATAASFTVTTSAVATATSATITATYRGVSKAAALTVNPAALSTVTASLPSVTGGSTSTGTVTLTGPAPSAGAIVAITSSNTAAATVPASVTVPAKASSATFTITSKAVAAVTSVTITATYSGVSKTASVTVNPPALSSVSLKPTSVAGATSSTGTLILTGAAPTGGAVVALSSSNTAAATVPASVTVAANGTSAAFSVTPAKVSAATSVTITATYRGVSKAAILTVNPLALSSLLLSPTAITGGMNSAATVTLNGAAPAGGTVVKLTSSNTSAASIPASVTVAAGATSAKFTVSSKAVTAASSVTITATYNGTGKTAALTVNPTALSSVAVSPSTVKGGTTSTGKVTLTGPAPSAGVVVTLASSNAGVATVPASVAVPANATTASFTISTKSVTASTSVTITGAYNGASKTATLTVN